MLSEIKNRINELQGRFTYRQRFIFFASIFFIFIPPVLYLILQTTQFFLKTKTIELEGVRYQKAAGSLMNDILQYDLLSIAIKHEYESLVSQRDIFDSNIRDQIAKLYSFRATLEANHDIPFNKTFSGPIPIKLDITKWSEAWKKRVIDPLTVIDENQDSIANEIKTSLLDVGREFDLFGNGIPGINELLHPILYNLIPEQFLISETAIFLYKQHAGNDLSEPAKINNLAKLFELKSDIKHQREYLLSYYDDSLHLNPSQAGMFEKLRLSSLNYYDMLAIYLDKAANKPFDNQTLLMALQSLCDNQQFIEDSLDIIEYQVIKQKNYYTALYWINMLIFIIVSLAVLTFIVLHVITHHLTSLINHVLNLSQGRFVPCFCSNDRDEFGQVGRAFDDMSSYIKNVSEELHDLSRKLADTTAKIAKTTFEQETTVRNQEEGIKELESTTKKIGDLTKKLANTMQELNVYVLQESLANKAKESLDTMRNKISDLGKASNKIVNLLSNVEDKIKGLSRLIAFMTKVSENANLLSLNAAIETVNISKHKDSFSAISQKIQRFANQTEVSTKDIKKILEETTSSVSQVKATALSCLEEIESGAEELINFSSQLTRITHQGKDQLDQFKNFTSMMALQSSETDRMINSLSLLRDSAQHNTTAIQNLNQSLNELSNTAGDLNHILKMFEKGSDT
jgi:methyl-accepting chemotaxis protein WspA